MVSSEVRSTDSKTKTADELIDAFCAGYGFATRDQLIQLLNDGIYEIWQARNIYALVEFVYTRFGKTLNVLTVTGARDDWQVGIAALEVIARKNDAKLIYSVGQLGWEKAMRANGYTTERVLRMSKVLT